MTNKNIQLKVATRADFPQIANFIAPFNATAQFRCLHSDEGSAEGVLHTINEWADEDSIIFIFAVDKQSESEEIVGALGAEYDSEQKRAWCWGPFAQKGESQPDAWLSLSQLMHEALIAKLPFNSTRLDGFIDQPFALGAQFYEQQGFHHASTAYIFVAPRPEKIMAPSAQVSTFTAKDEAGFTTLFDAVFPKTFYTGAQIVQRLDDKEQLFLYKEEGNVLGFCHAKVNEGANEGYIEFVGVREGSRGHGVGKALLLTTMHWLFTKHGVPQIGLTTEEDNLDAQALYRKVGFELIHTGLSYRKTD